uniref:BED-type domain-containing protein n=1 Tax=Lactuca sativa TaxID=4236 RepID=A0A9R1X371_LACSA|nr:hypothetical protein LSAT_V11C600315300 [Lactuca sativa]
MHLFIQLILWTPTNGHKFTCKFCAKSTSGGVHRLKQHLVGGFKNSKRCPKCPEHVREEVKNYLTQKEAEKSSRTTDQSNVVALDDYDEDDDGMGQGPLNNFYANKPEEKLKGRKGGKQQTINEVYQKDLTDNACKEIGHWFYEAWLPFNAGSYDSFHIVMESIAQFGPRFKPPSMYELRVPLLKLKWNPPKKC